MTGAAPAGDGPGGLIGPGRSSLARPEPASLADVLERVLDKGIVIAGDIRVNLVDVELLTIRIRLLVASVDRAREMGIDWWEHDPMLSYRAREADDRQVRSGDQAGPERQRREQVGAGPESAGLDGPEPEGGARDG